MMQSTPSARCSAATTTNATTTTTDYHVELETEFYSTPDFLKLSPWAASTSISNDLTNEDFFIEEVIAWDRGGDQPEETDLANTLPPPSAGSSSQFSRLREALTAPRATSSLTLVPQEAVSLPQLQQAVRCSRCRGELNSKCLVQACTEPDQTMCKSCGNELTTKCILAVCGQPANT